MFEAPPVVDQPSWLPTEVRIDPDYQRIAAIPRQAWDEALDLERMVWSVTNMLRLPGPPCSHCYGQWYSMEMRGIPPACPQCGRPALKPIQCAAIRAAYDNRGVFCSMRVGMGKTLPTFLIPTVLGAQRPGLIIPANLREKTWHDIREAAKWWRVHPAFQAVATMRKAEQKDQRTILSYEEIQVKDGGVKLVQGAWDVQCLDEFQAIKDRTSARHKKIKRSQRHFRPITGVFSGSVSTRGFGDFWAPMKWALGEGSPLPLDLKSFLSWCYALDEKVPDAARLHPGPLVHLTPDAKGRDDWERAQDAFGRRFISCPGVISSKDDRPPYGLEIEVVRLEAPAPVRAAVDRLRLDWATPDGQEYQHAFEIWAKEREISRGGWHVWDPQPPFEWRATYKAWNAFVRQAKREYSRTVDQETHVKDQIRAGRIEDYGLLDQWEAIKPTFEPNSVWRWLPAGSYLVIEDAVAWLRKHPRHAIVWVVHEPVGTAIAAGAGVSYYAGGGVDAHGNHIMKATRSCVASIPACSKGQNLQHEFYLNSYAEIPTTGVDMEQSIGRTHRDGSAFDTIRVRFPLMTVGDLRALQQARADCERMQRTEQRPVNLCYGTWFGFDLARESDLL